jgi:hypothetical protein
VCQVRIGRLVTVSQRIHLLHERSWIQWWKKEVIMAGDGADSQVGEMTEVVPKEEKD